LHVSQNKKIKKNLYWALATIIHLFLSPYSKTSSK
jgi:hypothetical protein